MRNRRKNKVFLYLLVILGITVGFALLSTTLKINGIAGIKSNTWNIHWDDESINVSSGSVVAEEPKVSSATVAKDTVSFDVELEMPGDYFEFEIDAVNEGSIDGALNLSENWITYKSNGVATTLPSYMEFSVKYDDNTTPKSGDVLKKRVDANTPRRQTYKIRVGYKSSIEELPENPQPITIKVEIPYEQYKDQMPEPRTCAQFEDDSWDTIAHNVTLKPDTYPVGCEKSVDMGTLGIHTVRVANNTTPNECNSTDFSQTACGFVLEFKDIVGFSKMNATASNTGGWENSVARSYVSNDVYTSLPTDLKNIIINTKVISGHGSSDSSNFNTTDKLYLLSDMEIKNGYSQPDTAYDVTRQLDYYRINGANVENYSIAVKYYGSTARNIWLRVASGSSFFNVVSTDGSTRNYASNSNGISPSFRIGKDWVLTNNTNPIKNQKWEYYYNNNLKLQDGWYKLKDFSGNDQYYYFENGFMKLGWHTENNNTYYLSEFDGDNNNYVDGNRVHDATLEIDGVSYTFDSNGVCTNCN